MLGEILLEEKRFSKLNGAVGVHEYDVDAEGNTVAKVWEWK